MEIFVVDNNSTDGSREYLEAKFPHLIFKWKGSNDGFAKANNSVLDEAKGKHILFLNPDTILPEDCFEKCLAFFEENKNCAALGIRADQPPAKWYSLKLPHSLVRFPSESRLMIRIIDFYGDIKCIDFLR